MHSEEVFNDKTKKKFNSEAQVGSSKSGCRPETIVCQKSAEQLMSIDALTLSLMSSKEIGL